MSLEYLFMTQANRGVFEDPGNWPEVCGHLTHTLFCDDVTISFLLYFLSACSDILPSRFVSEQGFSPTLWCPLSSKPDRAAQTPPPRLIPRLTPRLPAIQHFFFCPALLWTPLLLLWLHGNRSLQPGKKQKRGGRYGCRSGVSGTPCSISRRHEPSTYFLATRGSSVTQMPG